MAGSDEALDPRLRAIAEKLGLPAARFFDEALPGHAQDLAELVHLWHRMRTPTARAAVLDAARRILDEEGG